MSLSDPLAFAAVAAEQIIKGLGITALPIDPMAIARDRGFEVEANPSTRPGVSGMLVRVGNEFAITYATYLQNRGFENFSVAHELGHYFLPGHMDAVIPGGDGVHESRAGFASTDRYEMEADRFASGFLMPRHLFFPALERAGQGLTAVLALSDLCRTSLHATAIRFAQCTRDAVAVVVSRDNKVDHCFMSSALQELTGIDWLRKAAPVPTGTPTHLFNQDVQNITRSKRADGTSRLQQWFGGRRHIDVAEDVIGLGAYGRTLTVLYDIDLPEPEEEEEEARLLESWTPRFKR